MSRYSTYEKIIFSVIAIVILCAIGIVTRALVSPAAHIKAEIVIAAQPQEIWPYLTEGNKRVQWQTGVRDVIPLVGDAVILGFRAIVLKRIGNDFWEVEEEVTDLIENEQLMLTHVVAQYTANIDMTLVPEETGTRLIVNEVRSYNKFGAKLMAPWTQYKEEGSLEKALSILDHLVVEAIAMDNQT